MLASNRIFPVFIVLLIATIGCGIPAVSFPDPNVANTLVQETVSVALTQSAVTPIPSITETPTLTFTPEPPTSTPTATLTPTLTFTPTPQVPLVSVSVATNCRSGPGKVYSYRGALLVGETTEILGRDPTGNYWYVRNPDSPGNFCWLWGNYATTSGNILILPVFTPPPTPTPTFTPVPTFTPTPVPSFVASYSSLDTCGTNWWIETQIRNNGSISFKSASITVKDKVTDITLVDLSDGFTDQDGCLKTTTKDIIAPGDTYLLSASPFSYNPTGHEVRVTLTLCSDTGQKGICITNAYDVKP